MNVRSRSALIALLGMLGTAAPAAAQWSMLGDHQLLEGKTILDVGTIQARSKEQLPPVQVGRSSVLPPIARSVRYLEFRGTHTVCLPEDLAASDDELAAFLIRNQGGPLQLVILRPSIGSIDAKVRTVEPIACP